MQWYKAPPKAFLQLCTLGLFVATTGLANTYELTTQSNHYATLMQVKNCFDYTTCAPSETKFSFDPTKGFRSSTTIELSPTELNYALTVCGIVPNKKETNLKELSFKYNYGLFLSLPILYNRNYSPSPVIVMKELPSQQLEQLVQQLNQLIKSKQKEKALALIIDTFEFPTNGYKVTPAKTVDAGFSVTDHESKSIQIGDAFFDEPLELIRGVRHELEHALQVTRSTSCGKSTGTNHNLDHHLARELSAHFNDLANLGKYCSDPTIKDRVQKNTLKRLIEHYHIPTKQF